MEKSKKYRNREQGAIVIEATISLTAFVFAIFTILFVVNICYIQAKMSVALNSAAKDISQYSYLYYMIGADKAEAEWHEGTEDAEELSRNTIDGMGELVDSFAGAEQAINDYDFEALMTNIDNGVTNIDSMVTQYADKITDDPKGFIIGMGKMAGNELKEEAKVLLGQVMAKAFMKKKSESERDG